MTDGGYSKAEAWNLQLQAQLTAIRKERDTAEAQLAEAKGALDRLASAEAFISSRISTDEERARMAYAEQAAADLPDRAARLLSVVEAAESVWDIPGKMDRWDSLGKAVRAYREPDAGEKSEASPERDSEAK